MGLYLKNREVIAMVRRIGFIALLYVMAISVFAVSCGGQKRETPTITPRPTPPVFTPPAGKQTEIDLITAYSGTRPADQSMTPRALRKKQGGDTDTSRNFPRIQTVLLDKDDNPVNELGAAGVAFFMERFLIAPFMPRFEISDLPPPLQAQGARVGVMLAFGERPDGALDYEIVKRSVARNDKLPFEVFERNPNPRYPFVSTLPFEIQDLKDVAPGDSVIFYGYMPKPPDVGGEPYPAEKRGSISSVSNTHAVILADGSFTKNDFGAPVFTLQCGVEKLVGIATSPIAYDEAIQQNEAFVFGAREVLKFVEEQTGVRIEVKESKNHCPKVDRVAQDRAIKALSNGLYDFSYDLCDLKETCDLTKESKWVRPFEEVWISKQDPTKEGAISSGDAILLGKYVAVLASRTPSIRQVASGQEKPRYSVKYRLVWDGSYEYLTFRGLDSSGRVAVFERTNTSNFPMPTGAPIKVGKSTDLAAGHVLSGIGAVDLRSFSGKQTPDYHRRIEPFFVLGVSKADPEYFYVQGQLRLHDNASALCAWRDGECELVGFLFAPLVSQGTEALNRALAIEFILKAIDDVVCEKSEDPSCRQFSRLPAPASAAEGSMRAQALEDRARIIELLKDKNPDATSLLLDQIHGDLTVALEDRAQISILLFDETGEKVQDPRLIEGEALILRDGYLLTSGALFPRPVIVSEKGEVKKNPDITSNTLFADGKKSLMARIALPRTFLYDSDIENLFRDIPLALEVLEGIKDPDYFAKMDRSKRQHLFVAILNVFWRHGGSEFAHALVDEEWNLHTSPAVLQELLLRPDFRFFLQSVTEKMDILDVVLIDRAYGYALLKKVTAGSLSDGALKKFPVVEKSHLKIGQETMAAYAQGFFGSSYRRIGLVSPGTITHVAGDGSIVALNTFVSREIRGAPLYTLCNGALCLSGIIMNTYPVFHNEIKTEGFAVSLDLALEKIKEKTGIDLRH